MGDGLLPVSMALQRSSFVPWGERSITVVHEDLREVVLVVHDGYGALRAQRVPDALTIGGTVGR